MLTLSRDSSVSISCGYGLDDCVSIPGRGEDFSLRLNFQTASGAHLTFSSVCAKGYFLGGEWSSI